VQDLQDAMGREGESLLEEIVAKGHMPHTFLLQILELPNRLQERSNSNRGCVEMQGAQMNASMPGATPFERRLSACFC
jgi:hypothetical protein